MRQIARASFVLLPLWLVLLVGAVVTAQDDDLSDVLPITEDIIYTVRPSDTLEGVGALFDLSPTCIAETNDLERRARLSIGQELLITVACPRYGENRFDDGTMMVEIPREVVTFVDDCEGYRAAWEDTLDQIAFDNNVATEALAEANNIAPPYLIDINQCIIIPDDAPPYGTTPAGTLVNPDLEAGGGAGITGELYTLQRNDTLDAIAQSFDVSLVSLREVNAIDDPRTLRVGDILLIPDDAPAYGEVPPTEPLDTSLGAGGGAELHVVQPRQTADAIALSYDIARACLLESNDIRDGRQLQPGQTLVISTDCPPYASSNSLRDSIRPAGD